MYENTDFEKVEKGLLLISGKKGIIVDSDIKRKEGILLCHW